MLVFRRPDFTIMHVLLQVPWATTATPGMAVLLQVQTSPVLWWTTLPYLRLALGRKLGMLMNASIGMPNVL